MSDFLDFLEIHIFPSSMIEYVIILIKLQLADFILQEPCAGSIVRLAVCTVFIGKA